MLRRPYQAEAANAMHEAEHPKLFDQSGMTERAEPFYLVVLYHLNKTKGSIRRQAFIMHLSPIDWGQTRLARSYPGGLFERDRENFNSPFSQHWLMRTRLGWVSQVENGCNVRQPSGPYATQNTTWYRQHLDTMNQTGGKCGQNRGSQQQKCLAIYERWNQRPSALGTHGQPGVAVVYLCMPLQTDYSSEPVPVDKWL